MTCRVRAILVMVLATALWARSGRTLPNGRDELRTRLDSLQRLPPNLRYYKMSRDPMFREALRPARDYPDSGITMLSKWGRGPSVKVTGRDSLVFLSLGSEVAIINMANPTTPRVVSEVQARSVVARSVLKDSFLIIGGQGIEIWNVADPAHPVHRVDIPVTVSDICILDSLLLSISGDSFRVFNVALASNPRPMGACRDTGVSVTASGHTAYITIYSPDYPLGVIDLQNPANPHRVNVWGTHIESASAKDTFCYVTLYDPQNPNWQRFEVLDAADPLAIVERGHLDNAGGGDIYSLQWFAYAPGGGGLQILDVSDPDLPALIGGCSTTGWHMGVWADDPFGHAYVADNSEGIAVIDINDPVHPVLDTAMLKAETAWDIGVQSGLAVVADGSAGLRLLDVSDPGFPAELGAYDSLGRYPELVAVAIRDSFAFAGGWGNAQMRSVDISNTAWPVFGAVAPGNNGNVEGITIRGTFAYLACDNRFQIYDISNPRAMRLLGSVRAMDGGGGLALSGGYAYMFGWDIEVFDISNPANPRLVDSTGEPGGADIAIKDTFAFLARNYESLAVWSIGNPVQPRRVSSVHTWRLPNTVAVSGNLVLLGDRDGLQVFELTDSAQLLEIANYRLLDGIVGLFCDSTTIYATCEDAGVRVFEMPSSGVAERYERRRLGADGLCVKVSPCPARGSAVIEIFDRTARSASVSLEIHDVLGRSLYGQVSPLTNGQAIIRLSLVPSSRGVLFIGVSDGTDQKIVKLVSE